MWRAYTIDPEVGLPSRRVPMEFDVLRYTPPFNGNTFFIVLFLVFIFVGVLPASFVLWFCLGIFFVTTCLRLGHLEQQQQQMDGMEDDGLPAVGPFTLPLFRTLHRGSFLLIPSTRRVDLVNLHLSMVDRDFNSSDYDLLLTLDESQTSQPAQPLTPEDLAQLSTHIHTATAATAGNASSLPAQTAGCSSCKTTSSLYSSSVATGSSTVVSRVSSSGSSTVNPLLTGMGPSQLNPGSAGTAKDLNPSFPDGYDVQPLCPVCLDQYLGGDVIMTLPCQHRYHKGCITPWLQQQGRSATCPMCKSKVF
eukprot:jgi/Chrzof1/1814/Cz10g22060.t1